MQVELANGVRYVVLLGTLDGDVLCRVGSYEWAQLSHNDDMVHDCPTLTINKVYGHTYPYQFISVDMSETYLLWERKEVVELTMDEIAKKFGVPVGNLKIRKQ